MLYWRQRDGDSGMQHLIGCDVAIKAFGRGKLQQLQHPAAATQTKSGRQKTFCAAAAWAACGSLVNSFMLNDAV
jgi:hypothetical protein